MGRKFVTIKFDPNKLREVMAGRETFSERAEKYGVTRQAIQGWLDSGRIPPRALIEIIRDLDLSTEVVNALLGKPEGDDSEPTKTKKKYVLTLTLEEKS